MALVAHFLYIFNFLARLVCSIQMVKVFQVRYFVEGCERHHDIKQITFSLMGLFLTINITASSAVMLSVALSYCHAECRWALRTFSSIPFCPCLELTCPEGFHSLKLQCIENSERLVEEACQQPESRTRIVARIFDDLSDELCRVADMTEFVRLAHPDPKMAKAAEGTAWS